MAQRTSSIPLKPAGIQAPLSLAQQRLWFLYQLDPQSPDYNSSQAWKLNGALNTQVLTTSLNLIVARHETLRTTFQEIEGQPVQVVQPTLTVRVQELDWSAYSPAQLEDEIDRFLIKEPLQPFNLNTGPLLRFTLLRCGPEDHVLVFTIHHIVFDGTSMKVFCQELSQCYQATLSSQPMSFSPLPIHYQDYAYWQQAQFTEEKLVSQTAFWKQHLQGAPLVLEMPSDGARPKETFGARTYQTFTIATDDLTHLKQLIQPQGITLFMGLLAIFQILLFRYTGQRDLLVGTPIAGRNDTDLEKLIGFLVNTLVLRTHIVGQATFQEFLRQVRKICLEVYRHQDLPFEKLVEVINPVRDPSRSAVVQATFQVRQQSDRCLSIPELTTHPFPQKRQPGNYDLQVICEETETGIQGFLYYPQGLFSDQMMVSCAKHYEILLKELIANPQLPVSRVSFLTETEVHKQLISWNATTTPYPAEVCVHQLFEAQVTLTPDAVALVYQDEQLTYQVFNAKANRLAQQLQQQGVLRGDMVPIVMERSVELIISYFAIMKIGAAFSPLDPNWPSDRLRTLLAQLTSPVVLTNQDPMDLKTLCPEKSVMTVDASDLAALTENLHISVQPEDPIYVLYTSGSTGTPKGAINHHRGLVNRLWNMQQRYPWSEEDIVLVTLRHTFDMSIGQYLWPLTNGARLVLPPASPWVDMFLIMQLMEQERITLSAFVPSVFALFVDDMTQQSSGQQQLSSLRQLLIGGEALQAPRVNQFLKFCPWVKISNSYGPTEASISTIYYEVPNPCTDPIPIGLPLKNVKAVILDEQLNLVPAGVPGELHLGGVCVGLGYLNNPKTTSEAFIPNPFPELHTSRLYKTGDWGCLQPDGTIQYLGRRDHQVKINGVRMELGEIQATLQTHSDVSATVVLCRENRPGEQQLVAYVVGQARVSELRSFLQDRLPEYMVPAAFVVLKQLPLTPNGKIDRQALPAPEAADLASELRYVAPGTVLEELVTEVWQEVLNLERIGTHDNFFELGGHSLMATRVIARLRQVLEISVPLRTIFEHPTVGDLAQAIDTQLADTIQARPTNDRSVQAPSGISSRPAF